MTDAPDTETRTVLRDALRLLSEYVRWLDRELPPATDGGMSKRLEDLARRLK